ncbi:MAG: EF-hand domain-containing protein [Candidatus Sericytochromatia bacterium]
MLKKISFTLSSLILSTILLTSCSPRVLDETNPDDISAFAEANIEATGDSNNNVYIENFVTNSLRNTFNDYDKNKNGFIEPQELPQAPNSFKKLDKNNDNRLTFDEIKYSSDDIKKMSQNVYSFYEKMFSDFDTNKNGSLSLDEMSTYDNLKGFSPLNTWNTLKNNYAKNNSSGNLNLNQFITFMNNSFLEMQKSTSFNASLKPTSLKASATNKLPVVLVQGYAEPSWYFMYGIYRNLKKNGWENIYPVNLFPNIADIKEQAKIVGAKIEQAKKEQGVSKVEYVAHSMGGLIGRYYIQELNGANNINHYVSVATPHYGTYVAWAGPGDGAKQMRPNSDFLTKLNSYNGSNNISYTSIWTKTDEIVVPAESALLRTSKLMPDVKYVGHFFIMWSDTTYKQIRDALNDAN